MPKKDPRIDAYIANSAEFAKPVLSHIREVVHKAWPEIEETIKWGMPFFQHNGPVCHMAAFKQHCAFGFWNGEAVVGRAQNETGEAMGHFGRVTRITDLGPEKKLIGYIRKAAELNEQGIKKERAPRSKQNAKLDVPEDLAKALNKSKKARETFDRFSYSQRKEYIEWITSAKRGETRAKRLATAIEWMSEGKPQNWRYMSATK